jgi:hypothetical protein
MMLDPPVSARHSRRSPFDRVGAVALIWAGLFIAAAAGLTMLIG